MKGGYREGSGRKPKADEIKLIEKLKPLDGIAFQALEKGLIEGSYNYLKLFYEYRYGKPREQSQLDTNEGLHITINKHLPEWMQEGEDQDTLNN